MKALILLHSSLLYCRSSSWLCTSSICSSKVWNLESICWNLDSHNSWMFLWFSALSILLTMRLSKGVIEVILSLMWSELGLASYAPATGSSVVVATSFSSSVWAPLGQLDLQCVKQIYLYIFCIYYNCIEILNDLYNSCIKFTIKIIVLWKC